MLRTQVTGKGVFKWSPALLPWYYRLLGAKIGKVHCYACFIQNSDHDTSQECGVFLHVQSIAQFVVCHWLRNSTAVIFDVHLHIKAICRQALLLHQPTHMLSLTDSTQHKADNTCDELSHLTKPSWSGALISSTEFSASWVHELCVL